MSQLALALDGELSARHLSFIETGRSQPSRALLLRLSERLDIPLRDRNELLLAAGYAPVFSNSSRDGATGGPAREAIELILASHEPFPALAVDSEWNLVQANRAVGPLLAGVAAELLVPPINVIRLSLHPNGLAHRIVNRASWYRHIRHRLARQMAVTHSSVLGALYDEIAGYAEMEPADPMPEIPFDGFVVPLQLRSPLGELCFFSTTTLFGTPQDVLLDEIAIETFFPADTLTRKRLQQMAA